jgi:hypothetical protein
LFAQGLIISLKIKTTTTIVIIITTSKGSLGKIMEEINLIVKEQII